MSENQIAVPVPQPASPVDDDNLLDLLIVLAKHKIMIIGVTFAAALIAAAYSLSLPNIYTGMTGLVNLALFCLEPLLVPFTLNMNL